jgi:glycosyltransferase involved in cell wall biosynthesis
MTDPPSGETVRPLVSFALCTFNQEEYARLAVEAALAQTYEPLEIILSDDCSSDSSFSMMQALADDYRGPHRIVLNRNAENLGLIRHINKMLEMARGELLVFAAGDDVSTARRTEVLVEAWLAAGRPLVMHSKRSFFGAARPAGSRTSNNARPPRGAGPAERVANFVRHGEGGISGSTVAVSADMLRLFGGLSPDCFAEDKIFALRALLLGGPHMVEQELVAYRVHADNLSAIKRDRGASRHAARLAESIEQSRRFQARWSQSLRDVRAAAQAQVIPAADGSKLEKLLERLQANERAFLHASSKRRRLTAGCSLWVTGQRSLKWLVKTSLATAVAPTPALVAPQSSAGHSGG